MKRVFIVHGWGGSPYRNDWIPWAKKELGNKGYEVITPFMPDTNNPRIDIWVLFLAGQVGEVQSTDVFIGHSMGCQTILRYLEALKEGQRVEKVVLVAGFGPHLKGLSDEEKVIAKPWLETPIDWKKVKGSSNSFVAIFSDNDPFVPLEENRRLFEEHLGAEVIVEHNKGHFSESEGITELPILLGLIS